MTEATSSVPTNIKRKVNKPILISILVVLILLIAGLITWLALQSNKKPQLPSKIVTNSDKKVSDKFKVACSDPKFMQDFINTSSKISGVFIYGNGENGGVYWKKNKSKVFVKYDGYSAVLYFQKSQKSEIHQHIEKELINKLLSSGFKRDELNSLTIDDTDYSQEHNLYGYRKGNLIYSVDEYSSETFYEMKSKSELSGDEPGMEPGFPEIPPGYFVNQDFLPEGELLPVISISCSDIDQGINNIFDELLASSDVKKALTQSTGKNDYNLSFEIWEKHQNNIVRTGIGVFFGGGAEYWFQKENGSWKLIFEGQNIPPCTILEKAGIEPGVSCRDSSGKEIKTK